MKIDPNAPAFPNHSERTEIVRNSDGVVIDKSHWGEPVGGMSIRVWLAGQAMAGMLANPQMTASDGIHVGPTAVLLADSIIDALNK